MDLDIFHTTYYQFALYIRDLFLKSQITHIEINIIPIDMNKNWDKIHNPYHIIFYISLAGTDKTPYETIDWIDNQEEFISIHSYDDIYMNYCTEHFDYQQFINQIHKCFDLLTDQDFLCFFSKKITKSPYEDTFHRFHTHSLALDFQSFLGTDTISHFSKKHLEKVLSIKNLEKDHKTKI